MKNRGAFTFASTLICALSLLAVVMGTMFYFLFHLTEEHQAGYRNLIETANPGNVKGQATPYVATQVRKNVQKDLLYTQGNERLQMRMSSAEAEVVVDHHDDETELIEKMRDVTCLLQEELIHPTVEGEKPSQLLRCIQARDATYRYKSNTLQAEDVQIFSYKAPGHAFITSLKGLTPTSTAVAKEIEIALTGRDIQFSGKQLKGVLEDDSMHIETGHITYDGAQMVLTDHVMMKHPMGQLFADEMLVQCTAGDKQWSLGTLDMHNNVKFVFKEGGQLLCADAHLDYPALEGHFYGDDQHEFVTYSENESGTDISSKRAPLVVKSRKMTLHLSKEEEQGSDKTSHHIKDIIAENQVTVDYNHDFIAASDFAMYERINPEGDVVQDHSLPGFIVLRASDGKGVCQVTNRNGDIITASQIGIDTVKQQICFAYPKGALFAVRAGERQTDRIDFSADTLVWDEVNQVMTLRDNVSFNQKGMGQLTTDREVKVFRHVVNGKKQLHTMETNGKTIIVHQDENKELCHTMICYGTMVVDHAKLEMTLKSPQQSNGSIAEEQQVFFEDPKGQIYADQVLINYAVVNNSIAPQKVTMRGHVRIMNEYANKGDQQSPLSQYALADALEFMPTIKEMLLTANPGNRVLFYDKANDLQVSAPGLKIKRDPNTHKDTFKGIGDVRFNLIENEFDLLRKRFAWLEKQKETPQSQEETHE